MQGGESGVEPPGSFSLWHLQAWVPSVCKTPPYTEGSGKGEILHHSLQYQGIVRGRSGSRQYPQKQSLVWPQPPVFAKVGEAQSRSVAGLMHGGMEGTFEPEHVGFSVPQVPPSISLLSRGWDPACRTLLPACCGA